MKLYQLLTLNFFNFEINPGYGKKPLVPAFPEEAKLIADYQTILSILVMPGQVPVWETPLPSSQ